MYFFTDDIPYFVDDSFMRTHLRVDNLRPWFPLPPLCCGACARSRWWRSHYFYSSLFFFFGFWSSNCNYHEFFSTLARLPPQSHVASARWISLDATHCSTTTRKTQSFKTNRCTLEPTGMNFEFLQMQLYIFFCGFVKFGSLDPNLKSTTTGRNQTPLGRLWVWMQEFVASKEFLVYLIDAGAEMLLPFDTKVCSWGWPKKLLERVQVAWSWRIAYWFRV